MERRAEKVTRAGRSCSFYLMATRPLGGVTFVKLGVATDVPSRRADVQVGCPITIERVLSVSAECSATARKLERAVHRKLGEYRSSGEWFAFMVDDAKAKAALSSALHDVLAPVLGDGWKWTQHDAGR